MERGRSGRSEAAPLLGAGLTAAAAAAAVIAVLVGAASTDLYLGAALAAAAGTALAAVQLLRHRADRSAWSAAAPLCVVLGLLGVAASGASCGVACLAIGAPIAGLSLFAPDLHPRRWRRLFGS